MMVRRLDSNGDMCFGHGAGDFIDDDEALAQRLSTRLRMRMGEWFLDITNGLPWLGQPQGQNILGDSFDRSIADGSITACVLETDGVSQLLAFSLDFDHDTRAGTISITIQTDGGSTISVEVSLP